MGRARSRAVYRRAVRAPHVGGPNRTRILLRSYPAGTVHRIGYGMSRPTCRAEAEGHGPRRRSPGPAGILRSRGSRLPPRGRRTRRAGRRPRVASTPGAGAHRPIRTTTLPPPPSPGAPHGPLTRTTPRRLRCEAHRRPTRTIRRRLRCEAHRRPTRTTPRRLLCEAAVEVVSGSGRPGGWGPRRPHRNRRGQTASTAGPHHPNRNRRGQTASTAGPHHPNRSRRGQTASTAARPFRRPAGAPTGSGRSRRWSGARDGNRRPTGSGQGPTPHPRSAPPMASRHRATAGHRWRVAPGPSRGGPP
jgi:hypothetical protein